MERALRIAAAAALGLSAAWLAPTGTASAQDGITVGGWIEVIAGTSDHDNGVDGISRGTFSRISVSYDTVLDNGLAVAGRAAYQLNQRGTGVFINPTGGRATTATRMDAGNNFAPDVLYIGVSGGFGTINVGAHAGASCSTMPRPIAFLEGVDQGFYGQFTGFTGPRAITNGTFSESNYCTTAESVSYATPNIGGFTARLTYAPDNASDQSTTLRNAQTQADLNNIEDRVDMAAAWSGAMGAMNASIGVGYQSGANDALDSFTVAGTVGFGGFTFGASWFDNDSGQANGPDLLAAAAAQVDGTVAATDPADGTATAEPRYELNDATEAAFRAARPSWRSDQNGWTVAGKYEIGALLFGVTYSQADRDNHSFEANVDMDVAASAMVDDSTFTYTVTGLARDVEESALVFGANYAIGGGLTTWIEYMDLEREYTSVMIADSEVDTTGPTAVDATPGTETATKITEDDSLFMVGLTLGF